MDQPVRVRCPRCKRALNVTQPVAEDGEIKCPKCRSAFRLKKSSGRPKKRKKASAAADAEAFEFDEADIEIVEEYEDLSEVEDVEDYEIGGFDSPLPKLKPKKKSKPKKPLSEDEPNRSQKKSAPNQALIATLAIVGCLVVLVGMVGVVGYVAVISSQPTFSEEITFDQYEHPVRKFSCEKPVGWEANGGGGTGGVNAWGKFKKSSALIEIRESVSGSAIGDIGNAFQNANPGEVDEDLAPVAQVHDFLKMQIEQEYDAYEESDPVKIETKLGDSRLSEFVAATTFGGKVKGYRATLLRGPIQLKVVCKCKPRDWNALKAAFLHVIKSVGT
ncbi:FmdB family zinc ribbon protein [Calycomorphotria hydatis]|uniref:Uncharacterized protein n=1 Tax=Calycomorphotria hydatis TaxID=2528027 RepID=A0A517TEU9_9PLAN|nr:hypothetical protein [Calycomorphotria hydatis]QDT66896.1 hypothetical protein V22_41680 [Calycomorphotria hydatis]